MWHFQTQDHYKYLSESDTSYGNTQALMADVTIMVDWAQNTRVTLLICGTDQNQSMKEESSHICKWRANSLRPIL